MTTICWISLDPVKCEINFYPRIIANLIETTYKNSENISVCKLGSDFYNIDPEGNHYQTTTGVSILGSEYKTPGYRSVKRIVKSENSQSITIYANFINRELFIIEPDDDADMIFTEIIPQECLI